MKGPTQVRGHLPAPNVTRHLRRMAILHTHERTHSGEKPFTCSKCDKAFKQSGDLKTHERTHRGEKLFFCSKCEMAFTQIGSLMIHERTHTGE